MVSELEFHRQSMLNVKDPVALGRAEAQFSEFDDGAGQEDGVERQAAINKQLVDVPVAVVQVVPKQSVEPAILMALSTCCGGRRHAEWIQAIHEELIPS